MYLKRFFSLSMVLALFSFDPSQGSFWSSEPEASQDITDGECDWSLDGKMAPPDTTQIQYPDSGGTSGGNSGGASNGYGSTGGMAAFSGQGTSYTSSYQSPQSATRQFSYRQNYYIDEKKNVALHPTYPIGSYVQVTNPDENVSVLVQIVGRPQHLAVGRIMTLSMSAFSQIADLAEGVTPCVIQLS